MKAWQKQPPGASTAPSSPYPIRRPVQEYRPPSPVQPPLAKPPEQEITVSEAGRRGADQRWAGLNKTERKAAMLVVMESRWRNVDETAMRIAERIDAPVFLARLQEELDREGRKGRDRKAIAARVLGMGKRAPARKKTVASEPER